MGRANQRSQAVAERRAKALDLRRAGKSYAEIAAALGLKNANHASKDVSRALERVVQEAGEQLIALERERTEGLLRILWPLAEKGDVRAARECVRVMERRARMLGLDKPQALLVKEAEAAAEAARDSEPSIISGLIDAMRVEQAAREEWEARGIDPPWLADLDTENDGQIEPIQSDDDYEIELIGTSEEDND